MRDNTPQHWTLRQWAAVRFSFVFARTRAAASAFVVILSLLASFSLPSLQLEDTACGMACCKKSGVCGCRRTRSAGAGGPLWKPTSRCAKDCEVLPALPKAVTGGAGRTPVRSQPVPPPFRAFGIVPVLPVPPRKTPSLSFNARLPPHRPSRSPSFSRSRAGRGAELSPRLNRDPVSLLTVTKR